MCCPSETPADKISIHALREEGDVRYNSLSIAPK